MNKIKILKACIKLLIMMILGDIVSSRIDYNKKLNSNITSEKYSLINSYNDNHCKLYFEFND